MAELVWGGVRDLVMTKIHVRFEKSIRSLNEDL